MGRDVPENRFSLLERYFRHLLETGAAPPHDPKIAARVSIGALWVHVGSHHFFRGLVPGTLTSDDFIRSLLPIFLRGLVKP